MAVVKITTQKVKRYGKDRLCIQIPHVYAQDQAIELGEEVPIYRGSIEIDGKLVDCVIITTNKQVSVDS